MQWYWCSTRVQLMDGRASAGVSRTTEQMAPTTQRAGHTVQPVCARLSSLAQAPMPVFSSKTAAAQLAAKRLSPSLYCPPRCVFWSLVYTLWLKRKPELHPCRFPTKVWQGWYNDEAPSPGAGSWVSLSLTAPLSSKICIRSFCTLSIHTRTDSHKHAHTYYIYTHTTCTRITHHTTLHTHTQAHTKHIITTHIHIHTHMCTPQTLQRACLRSSGHCQLGRIRSSSRKLARWSRIVKEHEVKSGFVDGTTEPLSDSWAQLNTHRLCLPAAQFLPTALCVEFVSDLPHFFLPALVLDSFLRTHFLSGQQENTAFSTSYSLTPEIKKISVWLHLRIGDKPEREVCSAELSWMGIFGSEVSQPQWTMAFCGLFSVVVIVFHDEDDDFDLKSHNVNNPLR